MILKDYLLASYDWNLKYAKQLVGDVPERAMSSANYNGIGNHPSWTLGHLSMGTARTRQYFSKKLDAPRGWVELFDRKGPGDPAPIPRGIPFPKKEELLEELERQHQLMSEIIQKTTDKKWEAKCRWRFSKHLPTVGHYVQYMCTTHEAMHLGQLAAWRRGFGFDSALAKL